MTGATHAATIAAYKVTQGPTAEFESWTFRRASKEYSIQAEVRCNQIINKENLHWPEKPGYRQSGNQNVNTLHTTRSWQAS